MVVSSPLAVALSELAVAPSVADRRPPCVEEVGAERQEESGVLKIEVGHPVLVVHRFYGVPEVRVFDRLVRQILAAELFGEAPGHGARMSAERTGRQHDACLLSLGLEVLEVEAEPADGVCPANLLELTRAALPGANERPANAVRVVEGLKARLAPRRCACLRFTGVVDVAFDLLGSSFHDADDKRPRSFPQLAAERGVPVVAAGYHVFRHPYRGLDEQLIFGYAAGGKTAPRPRPSRPSGSETVFWLVPYPVYVPSSGRLCSRSAPRCRGGSRHSRSFSASALGGPSP